MSESSADSVDAIVQRLVGSLDEYELHGRVDRLLRELESGLARLRHHADADASWVEALTEVWTDLEIIYALPLHQGRLSWNEGEVDDLRDAVSLLRDLLARRQA